MSGRYLNGVVEADLVRDTSLVFERLSNGTVSGYFSREPNFLYEDGRPVFLDVFMVEDKWVVRGGKILIHPQRTLKIVGQIAQTQISQIKENEVKNHEFSRQT